MPKAAAPSPTEWATAHPNFSGFNIDELNRVVLDYAQIELDAAQRREGRSALARSGAKVLFLIAVLGLAGPLFAAGIFAAGSRATEMSEDFSASFFVICVYVGCGLGCISLLYRFVPWLRSTYRQWDRSMFGFSIIVLVPTVGLLVAIGMSDPDVFSRFPLLVAPIVTLLVGVGVIVAEFRLYSREKPPVVEVSRLTAGEIEVLRALRHKALKTLRSRTVVSYGDFDDYDNRPFV